MLKTVFFEPYVNNFTKHNNPWMQWADITRAGNPKYSRHNHILLKLIKFK